MTNQSQIDAVPMTKPDKFGQSHPIETPELIAAKLEELRAQVESMPKAKKQAYLQATTKCPDLVGDKDLLSKTTQQTKHPQSSIE